VRRRKLIGQVATARDEERAQYGDTVYLLEPNVKRSRGGLRDIQLVRWAGFARYGASDLDGLRRLGALAEQDYQQLRAAGEFLLRLRNEMHFAAGKANDLLDRAEQLRIAAEFGYQGSAALLPVEQFMREYFRRTNAVSDVATRFLLYCCPPHELTKWAAPLLSHRSERDFRVGPLRISASRRGRDRLRGNLEQILHLYDLANLYDKPVAHETREAIRAHLPEPREVLTQAESSRFRSLLAQPARLGRLLRDLHELEVLERLVPAIGDARCLLQFNEYHKYTVDEHCIRAVEIATEFRHDHGPLGRVYRGMQRKWLLHLALLLHDLGKGRVEDHSEAGREIAGRTAARLGLSPRETGLLKLLVHQHLLMSHLAFRRDTSDEKLIVRFAVDVGSPEALQMLFVMTAADLAAVGPGVLNRWKVEVLVDLYYRTLAHLAGSTPDAYSGERLAACKSRVIRLLEDATRRRWYDAQLNALPAVYLTMTPPEQVASLLAELAKIHPGEVTARGRYIEELHAMEYTVGTYENITPGVFHKLTGALTAEGLRILSAEIHTLADGLVFDRYVVQDPDYAGEPPTARREDVCRALESSLRDEDGRAPRFRQRWLATGSLPRDDLTSLPNRVRFDNNTSENYTILDIFCADRPGLLYTITRTLFELGLSVSVAKIGTYLDQVVDVFYVTDFAGAKIVDEQRLKDIRQRLLHEIGAFQTQHAEQMRHW
jgi:[protein-PII] uridylyltransferase